MTAPEMQAFMEESRTPEEWNTRAVSLKDDDGRYPDGWYELIIASGLVDRVRARWGDTSPQMKIIPLRKGDDDTP